MTDKKKIRRNIIDIRKKWSLPSTKLLEVLTKSCKALPQEDYERAEALELAVRYMDRVSYRLGKGNTRGGDMGEIGVGAGSRVDSDTITSDGLGMDLLKLRIMKEWTLKQYIQSKSNFLFHVFLATYTMGKWINKAYRINFLKQQIYFLNQKLFSKREDGDNRLYEINKYFVRGEYPDLFTTDCMMIAYLQASIRLKEEFEGLLSELLEGDKQEQLLIQAEIKGQNDSLGNINLHLPLEQMEKAITDRLENKVGVDKGRAVDLQLLTRKQTAEQLQISLDTLNEWTNKGILPKYKMGKLVRYKTEDILKALEKVEVISFN